MLPDYKKPAGFDMNAVLSLDSQTKLATGMLAISQRANDAQVTSAQSTLVPLEKIIYHPPKYIQTCVNSSQILIEDFHQAKEYLKTPIDVLVYNPSLQSVLPAQFKHLTSKICTLQNKNVAVSVLVLEVLPSIQRHVVELLQRDIRDFQRIAPGQASPLAAFTQIVQLENDILILREEDLPGFIYSVQILIRYSAALDIGQPARVKPVEPLSEFEEQQILKYASGKKTYCIRYAFLKDFTLQNLAIYLQQNIVIKESLIQEIISMDPPEDPQIVLWDKQAKECATSLDVSEDGLNFVWATGKIRVAGITLLNVSEIRKLVQDLGVNTQNYHAGLIISNASQQFAIVLSSKRTISRVLFDMACIARYKFRQQLLCDKVEVQRRYEENDGLRSIVTGGKQTVLTPQRKPETPRQHLQFKEEPMGVKTVVNVQYQQSPMAQQRPANEPAVKQEQQQPNAPEMQPAPSASNLSQSGYMLASQTQTIHAGVSPAPKMPVLSPQALQTMSKEQLVDAMQKLLLSPQTAVPPANMYYQNAPAEPQHSSHQSAKPSTQQPAPQAERKAPENVSSSPQPKRRRHHKKAVPSGPAHFYANLGSFVPDVPFVDEQEIIDEDLQELVHLDMCHNLVPEKIFELVQHFYSPELQDELQRFLDTEYDISDGKILFGIERASRFAQIAVTKGCKVQTLTLCFQSYEFDDVKNTVTLVGGQTVKMELSALVFSQVIFGLALMDEYVRRLLASQ